MATNKIGKIIKFYSSLIMSNQKMFAFVLFSFV